eukprot:TRINITY_DN6180_c0_g1_i1.p1 TRINITY_DN6180_c0_g1~~TRINITY_DN6180_c0_g1_i1.p1  ORF type:complete len:382 (+),score=92.19 TRINITY_DN6180_c0_g1_i1:79-1224(+)
MEIEQLNSNFGRIPFSCGEKRRIETLLQKKLSSDSVSYRPSVFGDECTYIESWKSIELANEVFGYNGWSCSIVNCSVDFAEPVQDRFKCGITVVIRITLRDGSYHEDVGWGSSEQRNKGQAFEHAKKEAVTDARKRALRLFGNYLGNCLYNKQHLKALKSDKQNLSSVKPVTAPAVSRPPVQQAATPPAGSRPSLQTSVSVPPTPSAAVQAMPPLVPSSRATAPARFSPHQPAALQVAGTAARAAETLAPAVFPFKPSQPRSPPGTQPEPPRPPNVDLPGSMPDLFSPPRPPIKTEPVCDELAFDDEELLIAEHEMIKLEQRMLLAYEGLDETSLDAADFCDFDLEPQPPPSDLPGGKRPKLEHQPSLADDRPFRNVTVSV